MRNTLVVLVAVLSLATASAVFGSGATEASEPAEPITLTIAGRDGAYGDGMQLAADAYTAQNPNVRFEILKLGGGPLFEQTVVDLRSGAGSHDVILIDDPNAPQYMAAGWLADLDALYSAAGESPSSDLIEPTLMLGRYPYGANGTLYALPHVGNVELFAYRKDLFDKHGLAAPDTWDQVLAAAKALQANEPGVAPVLFRGSKGNPIVTGFLPILWAFGGNVLSDGEPAFDSAAAREAVSFFLELARYAPEGVAGYQSAQVRDALYNGTGAMAIEVWPGWIKDINNPDVSAVVDKMVITKHPGQVRKSSPMIGIWLAAIAEPSQHKETAFDFLRFLTSTEIQKRMALEAGLPPTRVSVHQMPEVSGTYFWYDAQLDGLQNGVPRPRTDQWKEIEAALGEVLQQGLIGQLTAEQVVAQAHSRIVDIVE